MLVDNPDGIGCSDHPHADLKICGIHGEPEQAALRHRLLTSPVLAELLAWSNTTAAGLAASMLVCVRFWPESDIKAIDKRHVFHDYPKARLVEYEGAPRCSTSNGMAWS